MLGRPFSEVEVKETVFELGDDKVPGPDGFPIVFFQKFWEHVKGELFQFFNEFYENGHLVGALGASFIALIPKKEGVVLLKDFGPISLIGSIYKILAKVLANRHRMVLSNIISESQSAFVDNLDNRQILDSVVAAHECIDSRYKQNVPGVI